LFRIEAEDMVLAFLSDLGTLLTEKELEALGQPNVIFLPVGVSSQLALMKHGRSLTS